MWEFKTKIEEGGVKVRFEDGTVVADTIEEALKKIKEHMKEAYGVEIEVTALILAYDVDIE